MILTIKLNRLLKHTLFYKNFIMKINFNVNHLRLYKSHHCIYIQPFKCGNGDMVFYTANFCGMGYDDNDVLFNKYIYLANIHGGIHKSI